MQIINWDSSRLGDSDDFAFPFFHFPKVGWSLATDIYEENGRVMAKMTLPGIKADDLDITIDHDVLTISGRREEEKEIDKKDYYSKEIRRGMFSRSMSLPKSVDAAKAEAIYADGELTVAMPCVPDAHHTKVKVRVTKK